MMQWQRRLQQAGQHCMRLELVAAKWLIEEAAKEAPTMPEPYLALASVQMRLGKAAQALSALGEAEKRTSPANPELVAAARARAALIMPLMPDDAQEAARFAEASARALEALDASVVLHDPFSLVGETPFFLAYGDRDLTADLSRLGDYFRAACPSLTYVAPHCADSPGPRGDRRLRLGVCSAFLYSSHTIGKLTRGLLAHLPRDKVEIHLLRLGKNTDTAMDALADRVYTLPESLPLARHAVGALALDVMFYPEIGMDPATYFLAFARLAPVQCVTWGHPVTTGIDTIDYFLSSVWCEPEQGAQTHYRECLVRLPELPVCYDTPPPIPAKTRADFGLPANGPLYLCPQAPFKLHPDFDDVCIALLRRVPEAHLAFAGGPQVELMMKHRVRLLRAAPELMPRIHHLPAMPRGDFLALMSLSAALLDPLYFGGGNTAFEALALGVPVVTLPGRFMRARVTAGCYRRMGVEGMIATSPEEYVGIAAALGRDKARREACVHSIRQNSGKIIGNSDISDIFYRWMAAT